MAQAGDFKHIKLTTADDDEIIEAGIAKPASGEHDPHVPITTPETADDAPAEPGPSPESPGGPARSRAPRKAKPDGSTTLSDLDPAPMPIAQRIVIVGALILIIVALVYYFSAMR